MPNNDKIYQYCEKQRRRLLDDAKVLEAKEGGNNASSHLRAAAAVYGDIMDLCVRLQNGKSRSLREQKEAQNNSTLSL